jgi:hypothetical protein
MIARDSEAIYLSRIVLERDEEVCGFLADDMGLRSSPLKKDLTE